MEILDEQKVQEMSDKMLLNGFEKALNNEPMYGIHPMSYAYRHVIADLKNEIYRRMQN